MQQEHVNARSRSHHDKHDDWDEVHRQTIEVQEKQRVQKKALEISDPGDADEKEADEVSRKISQGESAEIRKTAGTVSLKGSEEAEIAPEFQSKLDKSKGGGQSLTGNLQQEMGSKMGTDFNDVRIHTGSDAHNLNESINAKAFTHGNDVYFKNGEYNPQSSAGKELLAHELVHKVQQSNKMQRKIQRFTPEDASAEMKGKKFTLDREIKEDIRGTGLVTFPPGQVVTAHSWSNTSSTVYVRTYHDSLKRVLGFNVEKNLLTPVGDTKSGLYQYSAGITDTKKNIDAGQAAIDKWKLKEDEYKKANNMAGYNAELTRLQGLQDTRYKTLNSQMIQQTMFNSMDASIKKWTDHYNKEIGKVNKWSDLDANLVKAMVWKESQMGTAGNFLPVGTPSSPRMTRFNVMQAIDSSGPQQIIMMNENDLSKPSLEDKYHYNQVPKDLDEAKTLYKSKNRTPAEDAKVDVLVARCYKAASKEWRYNDYFTSDSRWYQAVNEFFQQTDPPRNNTYDFWIQTGVRWLFEKRKSVNSWDEAIAAYNGSGANATAYKNKVKSIADQAKTASQQKKEFIPK